jgi:hypothetical protein
MNKVLLFLLLIPSAALAQSPFDGTWTVDSKAWLPEKPEVYLLADGVFRGTGWIGDGEIKADGQDRKVVKTDYYDTVSVRILDAHRVEIIAKKVGKPMFTEVDTISPDGNTLTQELKDTTESQPVRMETSFRRTEKAPSGSHALSGSWQAYQTKRSNNGTTITYRCTAEGFSAITPLGEGFDAKFDGKDYPVGDDPAHTMVSVKRISPSAVEITSKRNGRIVGVVHLSAAPDAKSIHVVSEHKERNTTSTYEMQKQP